MSLSLHRSTPGPKQIGAALVVNHLKHGDSEGAVALWIGLGTEAYFANLRLLK